MDRKEAEEHFARALKSWAKLTVEEQEFIRDRLIRFLEDHQFKIGWFDRNKLIGISAKTL